MEKFETPETYIDNAGTRIWYLQSKNKVHYHRLSGPAIEHMNGTKEWWVNGKRHRENNPAIVYKDGLKVWYNNGLKHRLDGPAVQIPLNSNRDEWWIDGIQLNTRKVKSWIKENNIDLTTDEGMLAFKITFSGGRDES